MRTILLIIFSLSLVSLNAQTQLPMSVMGYQGYQQRLAFNNFNLPGDSNSLNKKWSISKYGGLSTSFGFFNGGSTTIVSAPIGLQINRRLTNNLFAFAGVSVAPSYFSTNRSFSDPGLYKMNPGATQFSSKGFGMYSRAEAGLMYVNDERTFSISGSIGIERSSYPLFPSNRTNTLNQSPVGITRQ